MRALLFVCATLSTATGGGCSKPSEAATGTAAAAPSASAADAKPAKRKRNPGGIKGLVFFIGDAVEVTGAGAKDSPRVGVALRKAVQDELLKAGFEVVVDPRAAHHLVLSLTVDVENGRANDYARIEIMADGRLLVSQEEKERNTEERAFVNSVAKKLVENLTKSQALETFAKTPRGELDLSASDGR